jgi:hypothetical protein
MSSETESGIFCVAGMKTGGSTMGETLCEGGSALAVAVAVQANSTWLVSGATVILKCLKKSMPATAACKRFAVKSLP